METSNSLILYDNRIKCQSQMTLMTIEEYLKITQLTNNVYQRDLQRLSFYQKLIEDLLNDGVMPPISIVKLEERFVILDGLQRTNCLHKCIELIKKGEGKFFKSVESFNKKQIYVEIWEKMTLESLLYKMIVLNTGQKKMDFSHQLEILSTSIQHKLKEDGVCFSTNAEKYYDAISITTITEGLASFINGTPLKSKANAAEFLFNRFNSTNEDVNNSLSLVNDNRTYELLKWTVSELNRVLNEKYGERNPFVSNDVFYVSFMASLGFSIKKIGYEELDKKKNNLIEQLSKNIDVFNINDYETYYNSFSTGIGTKKRKLVFDAFREYFIKGGGEDKIDWRLAYDLI